MIRLYQNRKIFISSIGQAFIKLKPSSMIRNPVMFTTYLGAIIVSFYLFHEWMNIGLSWFNLQLTVWLWLIVLFANFAESVAESRGKAHADQLRSSQTTAFARVLKEGKELCVPITNLALGDLVICRAGDTVPADGDVIEGIAILDESAITGESTPVIRESGGERSSVTMGTRLISDELLIRVTSEPGKTFIDRMIILIEGTKRQMTPNEIILNSILSALTILLIFTVVSVYYYAEYSAKDLSPVMTLPNLIALLVCLIPTTIAGLLSAIGIAGIDRLVRFNVIPTSGRAVEAAGDVDLLILDKTGTITLGNRVAIDFLPVEGVSKEMLAECAQFASLADETPEGRSIVVLTKETFGLRGEDLYPRLVETWNLDRAKAPGFDDRKPAHIANIDPFTIVESLELSRESKSKFQPVRGIDPKQCRFHPFSPQTRMSGVDLLDSQGKVVRAIRKGAVDTMRLYVEQQGGVFPQHLTPIIETIARNGGTPLLVSDRDCVIGIVFLKDSIKGGIKERFIDLRKMGIRTLMITGDNPLTAAAIAAEAGVDDFIAEATPEIKLARIRFEQEKGLLVAMTGDGTSDAPALAQADVGLAMNTGTQTSREAGNMVDLDNNPTKLLEVIKIGKELLMTRGSLTSFSLANDIAKYCAILPLLFATFHAGSLAESPLATLNIMHLKSVESALLSTLIFDALIMIALIPLALRGVLYKEGQTAFELFRRNLWIYGFGGIVAPFIGIKLIDMVLICY